MPIKVNGKSFDAVMKVKRLLRVILALPNDEVLTSAELSAKSGISTQDRAFRNPDALKYRYSVRPGHNVWGKPKAITLLKKELG